MACIVYLPRAVTHAGAFPGVPRAKGGDDGWTWISGTCCDLHRSTWEGALWAWKLGKHRGLLRYVWVSSLREFGCNVYSFTFLVRALFLFLDSQEPRTPAVPGHRAVYGWSYVSEQTHKACNWGLPDVRLPCLSARFKTTIYITGTTSL